MDYTGTFSTIKDMLAFDLLKQDPINVGEWQSMNVRESKLHLTRELTDVRIILPVPDLVEDWAFTMQPDLPWAEEHFRERVSGEPLNPPPSHVHWPHTVRGNGDHTDGKGQFDHTYPERFWPRYANKGEEFSEAHMGVRFEYGDLGDLVQLLVKSPQTRQAYLPVWFPEDTGGHVRLEGARVPCSLGYHFLIRNNVLSCRYYLRSCDVRRHLHNDIYFAGRLMQWVLTEVSDRGDWNLIPGTLTTYISSLHSFVADDSWLRGMMTT